MVDLDRAHADEQVPLPVPSEAPSAQAAPVVVTPRDLSWRTLFERRLVISDLLVLIWVVFGAQIAWFGTGNAELKLDRGISERRVFPAVDVNPSGTRKDELLLGPEEARIMHKLRRILSALDPQQSIDMLIKQLKKTKNNREFLMQIAKTTPNIDEEE